MSLLGAYGIDSVHFGDCSQKSGQCGKAIHHRLIIALNQERDRAQDGNHTLKAFTLNLTQAHHEKKASARDITTAVVYCGLIRTSKGKTEPTLEELYSSILEEWHQHNYNYGGEKEKTCSNGEPQFYKRSKSRSYVLCPCSPAVIFYDSQVLKRRMLCLIGLEVMRKGPLG